MRDYRFVGIDAYNEQDSNIFFERKELIDEIYKKAFFERITVIYAKTGAGKSSLLKAGLVPQINFVAQSNVCSYIKINNFVNDRKNSLFDCINSKLKKNLPKNSFLDKIITPDDTLWYIFKRNESVQDKTFFLIFDQFENIFTYPEKERLRFKNELYELIFEQVPLRFRNEIEKNLSDNPDLLTNKALKKLYDKVDIRVIITIRKDKISQLDFFNDKIHNITSNSIEVPQLSVQQAFAILKKTSSYVPKYNIDDKFKSKPFVISNKLVEEIIDFLHKSNNNEIEAYQLQIIGLELEKISIKNNSKVVDSSLINEISIIYKSYYESIVEKIEDSTQQISARKFIENELLFEYENRKLTIYEGVATQKYELNQSTIDFLIEKQLIIETKNEYNEIFYELSHDALITPILLAKEKRIHKEIHIQEELDKKKKIEEDAKLQKEKSLRNRKIAITFSILFLIALVFAIFTFTQKHKAQENEKIANSTVYASYAFQLLENDPTISLRLAENAYKIDNQNIISHKAFFSAFYKTNIFYSNIGNIETDIHRAFFSNDGNLLFILSENSYQITTKTGREILYKEKKKDILSFCFLNDNKYFYIVKSDSTINKLDTLGNILLTEKINSLPRSLSVSKNDSNLIIACSDNNLYLFSNDLKLKRIINNHEEEINSCNFSGNDSLIISTSLDNNIIISDTSGNVLGKHFYETDNGFQTGFVEKAGLAPDSLYAYIVMNDYLHNNYTLKIWDWKNNKIIYKLNSLSKRINAVQFIDNERIIIASDDKKIHIINFINQKNKTLIGHSGGVLDIKFNKNKNNIISVASDKNIKLWQFFEYQTPLQNYEFLDVFKNSNSAKNYAIYADGKFDLTSTLKTYFSITPNSPIKNILFSEQDNYLLTENYDYSLTLFNKIGEILTEIKINEPIVKFKISESKKLIYIASNKKIIIYNFEGQIIKEFDTKSIQASDISFKTNHIAYYSDNKLFVLDINFKEIATKNYENISKINYTNQGKNIFILNNDTITKLNSKLKKEFLIVTPNCIYFDVSKTGNTIVWADDKGNCYLLNKYGEEIYNFKHKDFLLDIQLTSNEKILHTKTVNYYGEISINSWFISIPEIISYINEIKLYGKIYSPTKHDLELLTNKNVTSSIN